MDRACSLSKGHFSWDYKKRRRRIPWPAEPRQYPPLMLIESNLSVKRLLSRQRESSMVDIPNRPSCLQVRSMPVPREVYPARV